MVIPLISIIICLVGLGWYEYWHHLKNIRKIPIRVHVNGTRGKSSVTRLIAAGLRAGGIRTFAKTTGTFPKMIMDDGTEYPVYRPLKANILEQIRVVDCAASNNAQALVIECMALQPALQSLSELKMIQSTCGVITNARADHLDVMGPLEGDVVDALLGTTPIKGTLITAEQDYIERFNECAQDRESSLIVVNDDSVQAITEQELSQFSYKEHAVNVALSLNVCSYLGVDRATALAGMQNVTPDAGALKVYCLEFYGRHVWFYNAFAANDPESTQHIWNTIKGQYPSDRQFIMVLNMRADRGDRSRQFGEAVANWPQADVYVTIGEGTLFFIQSALTHGLKHSQVINLEGYDSSRIFEELMGLCAKEAVIVGVGNIAGVGHDLIAHFRNRSTPKESSWKS